MGGLIYTIAMSLVAIKNKYQIVIPAKLRKAAGLNVGDFLEASLEKGKIMLVPQAVIDRKHLAKLPKGIRDGLEDIRMGRTYGPFNTADELMASLNDNMKRLRRDKRN